MRYGDLGKRIMASIIDSFIVLILVAFFTYLFFITGLWLFILILIPFCVWMYFILLEGGSSHATVGKKIMGLYVAYENGDGITYTTAILRVIGKVFSGLFFGIGYLMGFFNDQKQCLHDMIAKTYVLEGTPIPSYYKKEYANNSPSDNVVANWGQFPELVGINGPLAGKIYQVTDNGLVIGRDSVSCQVVIPPSQNKVSRIHCHVSFNPSSGMFIINDRNSSHGTFVASGKRILYNQPTALRSGDRFYLATPDNVFEVR